MDDQQDEWIGLFGRAVVLLQESYFKDSLVCAPVWEHTGDPAYMRIEIRTGGNDTLLRTYRIYPWTDFIPEADSFGADRLSPLNEFLTVSEFGIIYTEFPVVALTRDMERLIERFDAFFRNMIGYVRSRQLRDENLNIPEGVQIISAERHLYYLDLQVALPGSRLPSTGEWRRISTGGMLRILLVPDMGEVKTRWIRMEGEPQTAHTALQFFSTALDEAFASPGKREEIYSAYEPTLTPEDRERLHAWLLPEEPPVFMYAGEENIFGDYQPKLSPDTVLDYMPGLAGDIAAVPGAATENLTELIELFFAFHTAALGEPGHWEEGNMILGARPQEYRPSEYELLTAEAGERIRSIAARSPEEASAILSIRYGKNFPEIRYKKFTFIHLDVMGSGRFFYVDTEEEVQVTFGNQK